MRRTSFYELDYLFDREPSRKIDQRVYMIRVHIVDFEVNALFVGVLIEVARYRRCGSLVEHSLAIQCSPDKVNPAARI